MDYYGTIRSDMVYTEKAICDILRISPAGFRGYYTMGLRFFQKSRKQPRIITGAEFLRFIEKHAQPEPDENAEKKP